MSTVPISEQIAYAQTRVLLSDQMGDDESKAIWLIVLERLGSIQKQEKQNE